MGHAGFVSHQWVAKQHPDPEFKQTKVLQEALGRLLSSSGYVSLDLLTEAVVPSAKGIAFRDFQSRPLFLWYDYFSVPQQENRKKGHAEGSDGSDGSMQVKAINSIPAYVAKCRYFFALCPTIACPLEGKVLSMSSWNSRGWCRLERASRELSENDSWILIKSSQSLEVVGTAGSLVTGSVGEGDFTVEEDRARLGPVMKTIVKRKLILSLRAGDLPSYRRHLNLQAAHFRGFEVEPVSLDGLFPGLDLKADLGPDALVPRFLHQNGLAKVGSSDAAGFWPLHYAAISGQVPLIEALLQLRADPNKRTSKDEPKLGFPPWISALDLAVLYRHNGAAQLLITARAQLEGGVQPAMAVAAIGDNVEGLRLLCAAGGNPSGRNLFGLTPLEAAANLGARAALEALIQMAQPTPSELSKVLWSAMSQKGGSAELVQRLVKLRADVDFQYDLRGLSRIGRLFIVGKSLQHRFGRGTLLSALAYHEPGQTPLMAALQSAQHEGAAALIAQGARLDIKNRQGWAASDFAISIPQFLQEGLKGDPSECRKIASLALPDGLIEVRF